MKKVLKTTVAASLVFGSIAGLPLSNKGLQELFGPTVASASLAHSDPLPAEANEWLAKLVNIYSKLTTEEAAAVKQFRDDVAGINLGVSSNDELVAPIVAFINAKQGANTVTKLETLNIVTLFAAFLSSDQETLSKGLNTLRTSSLVRDWSEEVLDGSGVTLDGENQIVFADLVAFFNASQTAVIKQFTLSKALTYLNAHKNGTLLTSSRAALKADLKAAFEEVIDDDTLKISDVLAYYTSQPGEKSALAEAIADTYLNFVDKFDSTGDATTAIMKGAVRSEAKLLSTSGGVELTPQLNLFGLDISSLVTWGVETANSPISFSGGKFVLSSSAAANTDVTAAVYANDVVYNELVFKGNITLRRTVTSTDTGTGNTGGNTPNNPGQAVKEAIEEAKEKLANASPQEKSKIIKDAIASVKEAAKELGKISLTGAVNTSNGKATVNLNAAQLQQQIAAKKAEFEALKASLQELDPDAAVDFALTFDLGDVDADEVEFSLGGTLYDAVSDAGVSTINVSANGVGVDFPVSEVDGDTTLSLSTGSKEEVETDIPVISDPVTVEFVVKGSPKETFSKPVELSFDVNDFGSTYEPKHLSIAKILENGSLEIVGGKFKNGIFSVNRSSFSTYVVVENEVTFTDTESVDAWAGDDIETVAAKGIVEGRGEGDFDPNANVTRAEFAKMIARALGIYGGNATENFSDVSEDDWFQPYVAAVAEWGITNGRTPSTFDPNAPITRAEMATMIARALQEVEGAQSFIANEDALAQFADADQILASLEDGVAFAADLGIVQGLPSGEFAPNAHTTRAQAAVMISRLLQQ